MPDPIPTRTRRTDGGPNLDHGVQTFLRRHLVALVIADGDDAGRSILVTRLPFLIGRGKAATMAIGHETVSRRHAALRLAAGDQLELLDTGSSNGTWVNDERVDLAMVEHGDEIRFGSVRYELVIEDRGPMTILHD